MNANTRPPEQRCPNCKQGRLQDRHIAEDITFPVGEETIVVHVERVPIRVCDVCGESFSGPDAAAIRHEAICRHQGLLTPREIKELRESLGMTQAELARITGIGEATISRWERGRLLQNKALDRFLRLLASNSRNLEFLKQLETVAS
jgi:putative zinc finger/helix-turn-helix YgiT family protein